MVQNSGPQIGTEHLKHLFQAFLQLLEIRMTCSNQHESTIVCRCKQQYGCLRFRNILEDHFHEIFASASFDSSEVYPFSVTLTLHNQLNLTLRVGQEEFLIVVPYTSF